MYGVPKPMLGDTERITFSNFATARRLFWEDTIVPQLRFYQEALNQRLLTNIGDPSLLAASSLTPSEAGCAMAALRTKRTGNCVHCGRSFHGVLSPNPPKEGLRKAEGG